MLLCMSVLVFHLACLTILIEIRSTILIGVTYCVLILTLSEPAENTETKARHQAVLLESCYDVLLPILQYPALFLLCRYHLFMMVMVWPVPNCDSIYNSWCC